MASEWREVAIGDLAEIYDGPHATPAKTDDGPVFLGISSLVQGRLDLSDTEHLSEDDYHRWTRRVTPTAGDVVFSYETRLGEAALVPPNLRCCLGRRMGLLRARRGQVDPRFLLYCYLGPQFQETLRSRTIRGSTVDRIPLIDMPRFPIRVPSEIGEQLAIAHILGTLDDKIELNRRMNETLEALARALFRSWFVDFDPVRAKAEGRDPGLPTGIADLFPDSFEKSELGEIPRGWTLQPLYDVASFVNGAAFKNEDFCAPGEGLPVIKIAELKDGITSQTKYSCRPTDDSRCINTGDLLYSWSGSPDTSLDAFLWANGQGLLNQNVFKVVASDAQQKRYVYYLLKHLRPELIETARNKQTTGLGHVTVADMKRMQVCMASPSVRHVFDNQVAPFFDRAFSNTLESRTLAALRDALLPKLISGELRVPDAERVGARVG